MLRRAGATIWSTVRIGVMGPRSRAQLRTRRGRPIYHPFLKRAHRKIAQPQIGVAAFFPDPEQRPVQRLPQQVVALAHGDADALAEKAALDERAAGEGAAIGRVGAVDPECQRDAVAEDEVDLAAAKREAKRL